MSVTVRDAVSGREAPVALGGIEGRLERILASAAEISSEPATLIGESGKTLKHADDCDTLTPGDVIVVRPSRQKSRPDTSMVDATLADGKTAEQTTSTQGPDLDAIIAAIAAHHGLTGPLPSSSEVKRAANIARQRRLPGVGRAANGPLSQMHEQLQDLVQTLTGAGVQVPTLGLQQQQQQQQPQHGQAPVTLEFNLGGIRVGGAPAPQQAAPPEPEVDMSDEELRAWTPPVDPTALQQMQDMGFSEDHARKALVVGRGNLEAGMEWLLEHSGDPQLEEPLPLPVLRRLRRAYLAQQRERNAFEPDQTIVAGLVAMGFSEPEVIDALQTTGNNSAAATAWLLGDRDGAHASMEEAEGTEAAPPASHLQTLDSAEELLGGSDAPEARMLQAMLTNPVIHRGLQNPRVLAAVQAIMQDPQSAMQYLADPEIGPVLLQFQGTIANMQQDQEDETSGETSSSPHQQDNAGELHDEDVD